MAVDWTRISISTNQAITGIFFGTACIAFLCRLLIQLRTMKRFAAEDYILSLGVACLAVVTGLYYSTMNLLYTGQHGLPEASGGTKFLKWAMEHMMDRNRRFNAEAAIWWIVVFSVKFAYVMFFRKLVFRLKALKQWWWVVAGFMVVAFAVNVAVTAQVCPSKSVSDALANCKGLPQSERNMRIVITTTVFDVLSDILIVSIPVAILWKVKIAIRQKFGLGTALCLSLVMAIFAIVRCAGTKMPNGRSDSVWVHFWQQQEASIAVIMVSITSFRSLFVVNLALQKQKSPSQSFDSLRGLIQHTFRRMFTRGTRNERHDGSVFRPSDDDMQPLRRLRKPQAAHIASQDPKIPSATISHMRTIIDRAGSSRSFDEV
ncbi:MAG: hypothetical protein M1831_006344 [Alyxoria varia]|nr:MAG: hypothetical protein M1831_006344 [Alyxoria varia]